MLLAELAGALVPQIVLALMSRMGEEALYIRALFMPVFFLFIAIETAIGVTNQVAVARATGRQETTAMASAAHLARVCLLAVLMVGGLLALSAPLLADTFSVHPDVRDDFEWFVRWVALAHVSLVGPVVCAATLRGAGLARPAALVLLVSAALEVATVTVLGLPGLIGWGIWSVPFAIAGSGLIGTAVGLWLLRRSGLWKRGEPVGRRRETALLQQVGIPVAITYLVIFASAAVLTWVVSTQGPIVVSGFAVAYGVQTVIIVPGVVIGSATAIIVNQHYGAESRDRIAHTVRGGLTVAAVTYLFLALISWAARTPLTGLLADDPSVAAEAARYLEIVAPGYACMGLVLAALTLLEQIGGGLLAVTMNVIYFAAICVVGGMLSRTAGDVEPLYWTMTVASVVGLSALWVVHRFIARTAQPSAPQVVLPEGPSQATYDLE
ncbi:MATE family efflux transporter [Streptomyces sp. AA0539]|uniref:MATE family efflux transporter n=1 Tax=Streptomyces sp. AA0539 TaxID=1210045 RepID=UPI0003616EFE|nr:MATE family efflux transporter [Streptomyces sp. AA0539]